MPISHCTSIYLNYSREPENICICESPKVNPVKFYVKIFCLFKISLALKFEPCVDSIMLICIALGCFKVPTFFCWMHPKNPELKSTAEFNNSNENKHILRQSWHTLDFTCNSIHGFFFKYLSDH